MNVGDDNTIAYANIQLSFIEYQLESMGNSSRYSYSLNRCSMGTFFKLSRALCVTIEELLARNRAGEQDSRWEIKHENLFGDCIAREYPI